MNDQQIRESITYWRTTAEHDYETMHILFKTKRYSDCLFFGHIALEKVLKALVVKTTKQQAPYIHDLVRLQSLGQLNLSKDEIHFLHTVNDFNIRARYPEHKLKFYKQCTRAYTQPYYEQIVLFYKKLCLELKQKK